MEQTWLSALLALDGFTHLWCKLSREPSTGASQADGLITHMEQYLTVPPGAAILNAIKVLAANGTEALVQGVYGLDFRVKVHTPLSHLVSACMITGRIRRNVCGSKASCL